MPPTLRRADSIPKARHARAVALAYPIHSPQDNSVWEDGIEDLDARLLSVHGEAIEFSPSGDVLMKF